MNDMQTYNAHETKRMHQVHGARLASFQARAAAFVIDFLVAFVLFAAVFILGARLASSLGLLKIETNVNLEFDLHHWYSLVFVVLYFGFSTYLGNGETPGKWLVGIRVVSLAHERMSLWHSLERARIRSVGIGIRVWFYPIFHSSEPADGTRPHC